MVHKLNNLMLRYFLRAPWMSVPLIPRNLERREETWCLLPSTRISRRQKGGLWCQLPSTRQKGGLLGSVCWRLQLRGISRRWTASWGFSNTTRFSTLQCLEGSQSCWSCVINPICLIIEEPSKYWIIIVMICLFAKSKCIYYQPNIYPLKTTRLGGGAKYSIFSKGQ